MPAPPLEVRDHGRNHFPARFSVHWTTADVTHYVWAFGVGDFLPSVFSHDPYAGGAKRHKETSLLATRNNTIRKALNALPASAFDAAISATTAEEQAEAARQREIRVTELRIAAAELGYRLAPAFQ